MYEEEESAYEDEVADAKQKIEHPSFEEARKEFLIKGKSLSNTVGAKSIGTPREPYGKR